MITTIKAFTCSYIVLIKLSATTKQLARRNSICCLKNEAMFFTE